MKSAALSFSVLLFALALPLQSIANTESHAKAIRDLFKLMQLEKMTEASIDANASALAQQTDQPAAAKPKIDKFLRDAVGFKAIEGDMVKLYQKHFTEKEVQDLLKFYRTPTGSKLIRNQMTLLRDGAMIGQNKMASRQADLQKLLLSFKKK